ncbi:MAG: ATP-binding cassette domain-containing protein [Deltaproteobacteria bacterium]|nr:MAG: ATP-binding cassette domain-containing protein [Deltaproteobacteria bacterium]
MIEIDSLTRRYGDAVALDGISARIEQGEVVGLLGPNGAGKTTMMKILTGFLEPSSGRVTVDGHDVVTDRRRVQERVGYLPEVAPLYPEMLVQDYLWMMAGFRGLRGASAEQAVARAVARTGLDDRVLQPIGTLSKGYRQRVGLAQAILHDPAVLILDEPTTGLDPTQIQGIRNLLRTLSQDATVLLSTHILQEIEAVCDRVLVLMGGRLVADASLSELTRSDAVELSVARGVDDVAARLAPLGRARRLGPDPRLPGFDLWRLQCADPSRASVEVAKVAARAGWELGAVGPRSRSLEQVFKELQDRQARREVSP